MDGIFLVSPESYEPQATEAMKGWFAEMGRPAYLCGPLLPSASKIVAKSNEIKQSVHGAEIQAFLDSAVVTSGENSVLYVRISRFAVLERKLTFNPADLPGIILLAGQGTGNDVGFLRRRHGSPDTFCEPFAFGSSTS